MVMDTFNPRLTCKGWVVGEGVDSLVKGKKEAKETLGMFSSKMAPRMIPCKL